jgi:UDP-3-O-[3-hydroxymyristoyl] glucosamine N-acyltransferase
VRTILQSITPPVAIHQLEGLSSLNFHSGSKQTVAFGLSSAESPDAKTLVFVSDRQALERAINSGASIIIAQKDALHDSLTLKDRLKIFSTEHISEAMAQVLPLFDDKKRRWPPGISTKSSIAVTAIIGKNVSIGDFTVIGENAKIGDGTVLAANVTVESAAVIGKDCYIHPQAVVGSRCQIGHRCEIHSNTTLGSDGFSYYSLREIHKTTKSSLDLDARPLKIPQVGIVVLEDDVEIGANCSIDRATLSETRIGSGTKLDNLVHIAHNVKIGKNCRITAGFFVAGSSEIGDRFICGGNTSVTDHVKIASDVMLAGKSGVTNDIKAPGAYGGYPLQPLREAMKTIANLSQLTSMRKQLHQLRKQIGLTND